MREVFKYAMKIEENGYNFYTYMAQSMQDPKVKDLFQYLADEEVKHQQTFEGMLNKLQQKPIETVSSEYFDYLRVYTDASIFQQDLSEQDMAKLADLSSALKYSMERESDSILYYHEIKAFLPASEHDVIDRIIQEERRHYVKLFQLAESME